MTGADGVTTTTLEAAERGGLTIAGRTVERTAARVAAEIDGVGEPVKVSAKIAGETAVLDVRLAVSYPASVGRTTESARRHLMVRVGELTGLAVTRVDVTVTALPVAVTTTRRVQ